MVLLIKTMELEVLKLFFPEELVAHFDITGSAIKQGKHGDYLEVEFTERNELPEGYSSAEYEANNLALCKLALFHFASFFSKLTIFNF